MIIARSLALARDLARAVRAALDDWRQTNILGLGLELAARFASGVAIAEAARFASECAGETRPAGARRRGRWRGFWPVARCAIALTRCSKPTARCGGAHHSRDVNGYGRESAVAGLDQLHYNRERRPILELLLAEVDVAFARDRAYGGKP